VPGQALQPLAARPHHPQASPAQIISHELPLDEAVRAYDQFDKRAEGWTKVILHPGKSA
jgi:glutathione-independent formaldehyde dehydrogenase